MTISTLPRPETPPRAPLPALMFPGVYVWRTLPLRWLLRLLPATRELLLIGVLYVGYTTSRLLASDNVADAMQHARDVLHVERITGLDVEHALNQAFSRVQWLEVGSSYWYALLHYVVTPLVLFLLWRRGREVYVRARRALVGATVVALGGYLLFPTAPPRLLGGYVDVLSATSTFGWWGADASAPRGLAGATNQLAAMPSMHVGWALWVSVMLATLARRRWQRIAAYSYVAGTALVVVGTANHWVLDAVVGAAIMWAALVLTGVLPRPAYFCRPGLVTALAVAASSGPLSSSSQAQADAGRH